jgi:hypothetical protein
MKINKFGFVIKVPIKTLYFKNTDINVLFVKVIFGRLKVTQYLNYYFYGKSPLLIKF